MKNMKTLGVKLGEDIKPDAQLKSLYYIYLFSGAIVLFALFFLPLVSFAPFEAFMLVGIFLGIPMLIIFCAILLWIPLYCHTISYKLNSSEIVWKRGVWFRKTGVVPYNRITNVDIDQGPVSRKLGIASIKIQTAGYSAPSARTSEIRIDGMKNHEEIRNMIIGFVRGQKPMAVETYEKGGAETSVLQELVKIRKLLEKPKRK